MRDLNYNHLRYFWAVAHDGSLTRAAEALSITQPGYQFTPQSVAVTGSYASTYAMTAISIPQPSNPSQVATAVLAVDGQGNPLSGVNFTFKLLKADGTANVGEVGDQFVETSGSTGYAGVTLIRSATYSVQGGTAGQTITFTVPATGSVSIPSFVVRSV